jgi:hypothetical protein
MKNNLIKECYIVLDEHGELQILMRTRKKFWYLTTNGAFGQRDYSIEAITKKQAKKYLKTTSTK